MTAQSYARAVLRLSLTIDRTRVDVVQTVLQCVVYLAVYHLLVKLIVFAAGLCRQSHHAVA